jgi:hypothetical protein
MGECGDHLESIVDIAALTFPDVIADLGLGDVAPNKFTSAQHLTNRRQYLCYVDDTTPSSPEVHATPGGRAFTTAVSHITNVLGLWGEERGFLVASLAGGSLYYSETTGAAGFAWLGGTGGGAGTALPVSASTNWILGFSPELQLWVAASDDNGLATSPALTGSGTPERFNWTPRTIPGSTFTFVPQRISAPGPGETGHGVVIYATVGASSAGKYYYSLNGTAWSTATISGAGDLRTVLWHESHGRWYATDGTTVYAAASLAGPWTSTLVVNAGRATGLLAFGRNLLIHGLADMVPTASQNVHAQLQSAGNLLAYDGSVVRVAHVDMGDGNIGAALIHQGRPVLVSIVSGSPTYTSFAFGLRGPWAS